MYGLYVLIPCHAVKRGENTARNEEISLYILYAAIFFITFSIRWRKKSSVEFFILENVISDSNFCHNSKAKKKKKLS